jgi:hypothetical protein
MRSGWRSRAGRCWRMQGGGKDGFKVGVMRWQSSIQREGGRRSLASGPEGRRRGVQPHRVDNCLASGGRRQPRRTGTGPQDAGRRRMQGEGKTASRSAVTRRGFRVAEAVVRAGFVRSSG